jgi:hypothetical protein
VYTKLNFGSLALTIASLETLIGLCASCADDGSAAAKIPTTARKLKVLNLMDESLSRHNGMNAMQLSKITCIG